MSVVAQTFGDWECIVVNDGSPSGNEIRGVVESFDDSRFRLVSHEAPAGPAAARNTGVRNARADYVVLLDEDDRITPDCLEVLLNSIFATGADIVCPHATQFGKTCSLMRSRIPKDGEILHSQTLLPWGFLVKKSFWLAAGGQDEAKILVGREDHEWWIRVTELRPKLVIVDRVLYEYRIPMDDCEENGSLNIIARRKEVRKREYIVGKHRGLYRSHPEAWKKYMRSAFVREGNYAMQTGRYGLATLRYCQAVQISREGRDVRRVLKAALAVFVGEERLESLLRWKRQLWGRERGNLTE